MYATVVLDLDKLNKLFQTNVKDLQQHCKTVYFLSLIFIITSEAFVCKTKVLEICGVGNFWEISDEVSNRIGGVNYLLKHNIYLKDNPIVEIYKQSLDFSLLSDYV